MQSWVRLLSALPGAATPHHAGTNRKCQPINGYLSLCKSLCMVFLYVFHVKVWCCIASISRPSPSFGINRFRDLCPPDKERREEGLDDF